MKNLLLAFATLFLFTSASLAQKSDLTELELGINLGGGIPVGDIANNFGGGFAWNINGYYGLSDELSAGLEIGTTTFNSSVRTVFGSINVGNFTITEILAVGRYKFYEKEALQIGGGLGLGLYSGSGNSELGISPRVYGSYMLTDEIGLTANIPFNLILTEGSLNYLQIRVGAFYLLAL